MESVRDNPVTIAKSGNAVGKSHSAARIATWFYKAFPDSQVYTTAAPPERNLQKILWGEIGSITTKHPQVFTGDRITQDMNIQRSALSFVTGVSIPSSGTPEQREAKFCADADDLFEMRDGTLVRYGDLIGRKDIPVVSVNSALERSSAIAEAFDNGLKIIYEITLDDGEVIRRTGNHPIYAGWDIRPDHHVYGDIGHKKGQIRARQEGWLPVENIQKGYALLGPDSTDFNCGNREVDENLLKYLAYMIGDGCFRTKKKGNRFQFTQERNKQLDEFLGVLSNLGVKYTISDKEKYNWICVGFADKRLVNLAKEWGLYNIGSDSKHIPSFVFSLSAKQISLFLSRLYATDGWASLSNKAEIGYASKSRQLVDDVQRLLRRLGIRSKIARKQVKWENEEISRSEIYWSVYISHSFDVLKFVESVGIYGKVNGLERCNQYAGNTKWRHANWKFEHPGYIWRRIVSIRTIGMRPTVGFYVPVNHTYLTSLVEHNSGKHAPNLLFIVDEADAVPPEVYKGIESCMSGGNARLLVMFNPRGEYGPVARMEKQRLGNVVRLSALRHPNVVTGNDMIPGAVTRETTVRRINEWTRPLAPDEKSDNECYELPEYLVGVVAKSLSGVDFPPLPAGWRKVQNPAFFYMVLGEYPPQAETQLISRAWIDAAVTRWLTYVATYGEVPPVRRATVGLDVAEYGKDFNVLTWRFGGWVAKPERWNGLDTDATAIRTNGIVTRDDYDVAVMVDGTGVGAGVAPRLNRLGVAAVSVKVASAPTYATELGEFFQLRDELWWSCREWLRTDSGAMIPPDDELIEELSTPLYSVRGGKIRITDKDTMREMLGRSPDKADSLCLTFARDGGASSEVDEGLFHDYRG